MGRLARIPLALASLAPAVLVATMVSHVPPSVFHVPRVQLSAAGKAIALSPDALGARRTERGLEVRGGRLDRTLTELARSFAVPPRAGTYRMTAQGVVVDWGTTGAALDVPAARRVLLSALARPGLGRSVTLPLVAVPPPAPPRYAIVVRLSEFHLDLYDETTLQKRYLIGVGQLSFPTPPGVYHIQWKEKNPAWINPGSSWARSMPDYIPPGPRNPLGTRALHLDRGALVIHGTPQPWSIGHRASHGCMRMYRADVEELFEMVPVGTPVFIIP